MRFTAVGSNDKGQACELGCDLKVAVLGGWFGYSNKMVSVGLQQGGDSCGEQQWTPVQVNAPSLPLALHEGHAWFVYGVDAGTCYSVNSLSS